MINQTAANPFFHLPFIPQDKSTCATIPFASVSQKFAEIRKARESCAENKLDFTYNVISSPIIWANRALRTTYLLSFVKPFADVLMIVQPVLTQVLSKMLIVCGVVYAVSLFRYFCLMGLQYDFRSNITSCYKSPVCTAPEFSTVFEKLNALQSHIQTMLQSDTDHRHTITAIEDLEKILQYTSVYDMAVTIQIQKVKQAILLDALNYLKTYDQSLESRITPWMTDQLHTELDFLINCLSTGDMYAKNYAQVRVEHLLSQIDTEAKKVVWAHILGAIAIAFTLTGTIMGFVLTSGTAPLILFALSYFFMGLEYALSSGSSRKEGWSFDIKDCIPTFVKYNYDELEKKYQLLKNRMHIDLSSAWGHLTSQIHCKTA